MVYGSGAGFASYQRWDLWSAQGSSARVSSHDFFYGAALALMLDLKNKIPISFIYCLLSILYLIMRSLEYTREKNRDHFIK